VKKEKSKSTPEEFKPKKSHLWIFNLIFLLILLLAVGRVPFTGCYIDSFIFDLLFGLAKYVIYLLLLVTILFSWININKFKKVFNRRFVVATILLVIFIMLIISIVTHWDPDDFTTQVKNDWNGFLAYAKNTNEHYIFLNETCVWAGAPTNIVYMLSREFIPILYILVLLPLFLLSLSIYTNRNLTFTRLFGKFFPHAFKKYINAEDVNIKNKKIKKFDKTIIESDILHGGITKPSVDYLVDTSVDNQVVNNQGIEIYMEKISYLLKKNNITDFEMNKNIMPIYSQIILSVPNEDKIDEVYKLHNNIKEQLNVNSFLLIRKNKTLTFEFINKSPSAICFKELIKKSGNLNRIPVGIDLKKNTIFWNLDDNNISCVLGRSGSGAANLVKIIIMYYCFRNSPKDAEIVIIDPKNLVNTFYTAFSTLPHMNKSVINTHELCKKYIQEYKHNPKQKRLVLFFNYDGFINGSIADKNLFINFCKKFISSESLLVLFAHSIDNNSASDDILELNKQIFVFKTNTENESLAIMDSSSAFLLHGYGDAYMLPKDNTKVRFQTCFVSANEVEYYNELISTFYEILEKSNKK